MDKIYDGGEIKTTEMDAVTVKLEDALKAHNVAMRKKRDEHREFRNWAFRAIAELDYRLTVAVKNAEKNRDGMTQNVDGPNKTEPRTPMKTGAPRAGASHGGFSTHRAEDVQMDGSGASGAVRITPGVSEIGEGPDSSSSWSGKIVGRGGPLETLSNSLNSNAVSSNGEVDDTVE